MLATPVRAVIAIAGSRLGLRALTPAVALAIASLAVSPSALADEAVAPPPAPRQHELLRLLHQDCGACHGLRLTGGLGPALTRQALHDKPDESLVATIVAGRTGTPMPPWRPFISEAEARWLVARLKEGRTDAE